MVILTCRTLHFWRVAICSMSVTEPETISSSQRRPRAIALTRRARRSIRVGRISLLGNHDRRLLAGQDLVLVFDLTDIEAPEWCVNKAGALEGRRHMRNIVDDV